ncbi:MAG: DUF177 domain-containing protein [Oscillospiraceae bacterium]|nr:DUF177 domain-containing protein [Oscillospiraceae bacterium]
MLIDLKQVFDVEGEAVPFTHELSLSGIELWGNKPFDQPVHLVGKVENRSGVVLMKYRAFIKMNVMCGRCLKEQRREEEYSFEHVLVLELNDLDNGDFIVVPGAQLELDELATSDILLELPSTVLCRPDCKGLCPVCGCDLNERSCGCSTKQTDPRLEILSKFFE